MSLDVVDVFFFQAEDGIRDIGVTGVQTCALPICDGGKRTGFAQDSLEHIRAVGRHVQHDQDGGRKICGKITHKFRSEERRVGKECKSRWWEKHQKKKEEEG